MPNNGDGRSAMPSEWERHVREGLIPKLHNSALGISVVPAGDVDAKFAVELGLLIMLDKPIIAVVPPGVDIPPKLARVADHIITADFTTDEGYARQQLRMAIAAVMHDQDTTERRGG